MEKICFLGSGRRVTALVTLTQLDDVRSHDAVDLFKRYGADSAEVLC